MARQSVAVILASLLAVAAQTTPAQDTPQATPPSPPRTDGVRPGSPRDGDIKNRPDRPLRKGPEFNEMRKDFEHLPPEQKQKVRENLQRWKDMSPEERNTLRDREQHFRKRMTQETDEAIKNSGLQLDADRRQVYVLRFAQERRKIEEQLRKEMDEKRRPLLDAMIERLKAEFSAPASPSPSPVK